MVGNGFGARGVPPRWIGREIVKVIMFDRNSFLRNVKDHKSKLFIIFYWT